VSTTTDEALSTKTCPSCGAEVAEGQSPCPSCGVYLSKWNLFLTSVHNLKKVVADEVSALPAIQGEKTRVWGRKYLDDFLLRSRYALSLVIAEKEIVTFALLQWAAIAIGYYVWVQILGLIPPAVWEDEHKLMNIALNLVVLAWSFVCVGLVAFPLAILSGCMGASHFLRKQGYPSTIAGCLNIVLPRAWNLWIFYWLDAWTTVEQILERLPKRGDAARLPEKAVRELFYYAWKVGTVAVLPAILCGHNLISAGKQSVEFVKNNIVQVMLLRGGYSLACWVVGVGSYIGAVFFYAAFQDLFATHTKIYTFYLWMGIPIVLAAGVVELFLRPIFIISSFALYSDHLNEAEVKLFLPSPPSHTVSAFVTFGIMAIGLLAAFLYRDQLGLTNILHVISR
jgi:hypothetical protein